MTTTYLANYQPYPWHIESVDLNFALYDEYALVINEMIGSLAIKGHNQLYLCGSDACELLEICLNGRLLNVDEYQRESQDLIILNCPSKFTITITTKIYPQNNTQLSGLYRSNGLFCTQCEAEGFRRITFFPDRPDVLSRYTTTISADLKKYPVLLSNGNLIGSGLQSDSRHWVKWVDPFKKPSYLFALVAGDLAVVEDHYTTMSGRQVVLRIYVEPGNENQCAHAMHSLKQAMRWDEEVYGLEYDLDIFMIVAVSYFNMGAMENKGLNIFNSKYILASPEKATDQDYANIEGVVAHEYFHNWTGNRVTCRDWFQLSLKEGLTVFRDQEFSRDLNSRDVQRIGDVKVLRQHQFSEDAGSMSHPVRPSSYQEINNFYTATIYNKGAEVIRMLETLVGKAGFRLGMDLYFKRHDGCAVTIDDFVAAMADANNIDLTQFKLWYVQSGTPRVKVSWDYQNNCLTIKCTQIIQEQQQPFHIPIKFALFDAVGKMMTQSVLELKDMEQTFEFKGIQSPPLVSLLRDFSAPIILQQPLTTDHLSLLRFETDGFAQWEAAQQLALTAMRNFYAQQPQDLTALFDSYSQIITNEKLDPALRTELLTPPSFSDLILDLSLVDVDKAENARDAFKLAMSNALFTKAQELYHVLLQQEDHSMSSVAYGRRQLRNVCLEILLRVDEKNYLNLCWQQLVSAQTMTDQIASLSLLSHADDQEFSQKALQYFAKRWQQDELVLDKWFAVQATNPSVNTLGHVKKLTNHPAFDYKNPNKVRSLIGTFTQINHRCFHAINGSGYEFLTESLLLLDKINSQISARLATPFTQWQHFDKNRQQLMQKQLVILANHELSRDLREVIESCGKA